ncbi:hypothetical protein CKO50_02025 [Pseudoalteromonas sp. HM-SA03]|uniref:hypothetical protein n=1 Tax=Pseudoalteromonas sp. HM-SA03 TaxID=2029678 RepID=UPI000BAE1DC0|nr:hypothetical protein [Pseudoalteromonas sp. HM-SA03]PAY02919.1 hypothetical protein CKO50_02025 [Pseudoalteromonas sp. HM-SA03]
MSPELTLILLNFILLFVAYVFVYPKLKEKSLASISKQDLLVTAVSLIVSGSLYYGKDIEFSLIFFESNWVVFTIIAFSVIEIPFLLWFKRRYNIKFGE